MPNRAAIGYYNLQKRILVMTKENKTKEIVKSPVVRQNNSSSGNNDYVGFKFSKKGDKRRIETFEGRRENDGRVFENRRVWRDDFVSPPTEERESTVTIEEIDDNEEIGEKDTGLNNEGLEIDNSKAVDNRGVSQSNKRQQTDDEENHSVKRAGKKNKRTDETTTQKSERQSEGSGNNVVEKEKKQSEGEVVNQVVKEDKKGVSQKLIPLGIGGVIVSSIVTVVKVFRR